MLVIFSVSASFSCSERRGDTEGGSKTENHGITVGKALLLCDETILPLVEDEVDVFEGLYQQTDITIEAYPEIVAVNKLRTGDAQLAVLTRELTYSEDSIFRSKKIIPRTLAFATDALALVTNRASTDTVLSVEEVMKMMKGEAREGRLLVFENGNSSSLRYFNELAGIGASSNSNVYAVGSTLEVLKYVEKHKDVYGVVALNWLYQPSMEIDAIIDNVHVVGIQDKAGNNGDEVCYKPSQSNLALGLYPFQRRLYFVNVQGRNAVGMGFSSFLYGERGQKIVLKSGLLPDSIPGREILIKN